MYLLGQESTSDHRDSFSCKLCVTCILMSLPEDKGYNLNFLLLHLQNIRKVVALSSTLKSLLLFQSGCAAHRREKTGK